MWIVSCDPLLMKILLKKRGLWVLWTVHETHTQNAKSVNARRLPLSKHSLSHKHRQKDHFQNEINFDRQKKKK